MKQPLLTALVWSLPSGILRDRLSVGLLFPLGDSYLSDGAAALALDPAEIDRLLNRHHSGDWGYLGEDDKRANDLDLKEGGRLLSRYDIEAGSFYVITEWDRSVTTVMLREEY
jgi:hypothetical protein